MGGWECRSVSRGGAVVNAVAAHAGGRCSVAGAYAAVQEGVDMRWLIVPAVALSAIPVLVMWAMRGQGSLYAQFRREVELRTSALGSSAPAAVVTAPDLERLPQSLR